MALDPKTYDIIPFFTAGAAAGTSSDFKWRGGYMLLTAKGTWGSLQVNVLDPEGNVIPLGAAVVANGVVLYNVPEGVVRAVTTGGSAYTIYGHPLRLRNRY